MKISGFSFVRNASLYDFPLDESLRSLLPLCDQVVVSVGRSEDDTLERVRAIGGQKTEIIETIWDDSLREGGKVYAQQTDIALSGCTGDWCIYLQADEVLHEEDNDLLLSAIEAVDNDPSVDALLFRYLHFYGSYEYIGSGRKWYRREVRAFRNTGDVISWGDAQGFRRRDPNGKASLLRAHQTDIRVFHYGWVRPPEVQGRKQWAAHRYWHDDEWMKQHLSPSDLFDYSGVYDLRRFDGLHPGVMKARIEHSNVWTRHFDPHRTQPKPPLMKLADWIEQRTGWRIGEYRNFIEI